MLISWLLWPSILFLFSRTTMKETVCSFFYFAFTHSFIIVVLVTQLCLTLCNPIDCICQAPRSTEFSRQEHWSGLPCPPAGVFPTQGSKPGLPHCGILYCSATWEALLLSCVRAFINFIIHLKLLVRTWAGPLFSLS